MQEMNRPTRESTLDEIFDYICLMEDRLGELNRNGAVALASAMNKKLIELAQQLNASTIGFDNGVNDKKFDRFIKLLSLSADLIKDFKAFLHEHGDEIEKEEKMHSNVMESFAKKNEKK